MILPQLNILEGSGKWAVPIAVYGAQSPEEYLQEISRLRKQGFKVLAAAGALTPIVIQIGF